MAWKISKTVTCAGWALCLAAAVCTASAQEDPKQTGPLGLVIEYRCAPAQRTALRNQMLGAGLRQFEKWKEDATLSSYHILFSRYVDTNNWDMLALLTFPDYAGVARWKRIEQSEPAGLPVAALTSMISISSYPVDLMRNNVSEATPVRPVYFVVPYTFSAAPGAYLQYADDYVRPQFDGWMKEQILSGYQIYLQRYTANRPWDTLIFLKYKDDESFGAREKVVAKVRGDLQSNPTWKAASDSKQNLRKEKEAIIADELVLTR